MNSITPDTPILDPTLDQFRRWPFAQRIAQTIVSRTDPSSIIIGIYGSWGDGKTTVLNFIQHELKSHNAIVSFTFNPWRFTDEPKMLVEFFRSLAEAVGKSESTTKEKIGDFIGKYGTTIASAFGQGDTAKTLSELLSTIELEDLKNRVNDILKSAGKRVVILIDDIDRLDKNEIQSIFRLVKLNADFINTAYILAFDDEMVAAALQEKYSIAGIDSGHSFLEKIIQVPLDLPTIPDISLRQFCFSRVDQGVRDAEIELSQDDVQAFVRGYIDGLEIRIKTPRMATRYTNILSFSLPILKGEINPVDLMLVEGIRLFYPKLYEIIKKYPEIFLGRGYAMGGSNEPDKKRGREIIETGLRDLNSDESNAARRLLEHLFPRLQTIFGNTYYGNEWDITWSKEKKIASKDYFTRYFSYSIPTHDVSDLKLEHFFSLLSEGSNEETGRQFGELVGSHNSDTLISKLRRKASQLDDRQSKTLALLVSVSGSLFPTSKQAFSFRGVFSQAAMLVGDLLLNINNKEERMKLANELTMMADPITFAAEIVSWFRVTKENSPPNCFSIEEKSSLRTLLASRIRKLFTTPKIFDEFPDDVCYLLSIWSSCGSKEEVADYLKTLFSEQPSKIELFLLSCIPMSFPMDTGIGKKGDLERDEYNRIAGICNPGVILGVLESLYGNEIYVPEYPYHFNGDITGLEIAQQFAWIHNKVMEETKTPPQD